MRFILLLMFFVSCGSTPQDISPAPIENQLFTLELATNARRDVGVIGGMYDLNTLTDEYLEFLTVGSGNYSIRSQRCLYERTETYTSKKPKAKRILIKDLVKDMPDTEFACIFNIVLFIDGLDRGFKGQFYMMKKEFDSVPVMILDHQFDSIAWFQISESANLNLPVKFNVTGSGQAIYEGCGTKQSLRFQGPFYLSIKQLVEGGKKPECVYTVGFLFDDGRKAIVDINLKIFSDDNISLGTPSLRYANEDLLVIADKLAAYVAIGDDFKKGNKIERKVKKDEAVYIRVMTANGRYELLLIKNGEVIWTPTRKY